MTKILKSVGNRDIYKVKGNSGRKVVLAYLRDKHEWVTWGTNDSVDDFFWGHYYDNRRDAEADFEKRG